MDTINPQSENEDKSKVVWWVIIIIVFLLIITCAVFFWRSIPYTSVIDFSIFKKDDISSIEKDLNALDTSILGSELVDIEKEINQ